MIAWILFFSLILWYYGAFANQIFKVQRNHSRIHCSYVIYILLHNTVVCGHKSDMTYKLSAKPGEEVWNRRQFVPRASFKTKTTTKALIGLHNPYFWIWRPFLQPISIGPGIQSEEKKAQRRSFILPQCDLPGVPNTTPKPYTWSCCKFLTNIFPFLFLSLRMNLLWKEIWWEERYGLAYLSQLPCN